MAQRATEFAKPRDGSPDSYAHGEDLLQRLRVIPLHIAPLLKPYRKYGRLSIRVERLPNQARLSSGRNNGDNSWSLTYDELEDLNFLAPESADIYKPLAIRIISLDDGNASTLALLDYQIAKRESPADSATGPFSTAPDPALSTEIKQLKRELDHLRQALSARESELLAAATAADENVVEQRVAWDAERLRDIDKMEKRFEQRIKSERESWEEQADAILLNAEKAWKEAENARLHHAQQSETRRALTAAQQTEREAQKNRDDLKASERKLAETQALLSSREAEFSRHLQEQIYQAKSLADAALKKAQQDWSEAENARLTNIESRWQAKLAAAQAKAQSQADSHAKALTLAQNEARTQAEAAANSLALAQARNQSGDADTAELTRLQGELAQLKTALSQREQDMQTAQNQLRQAHEIALGQAKAEWAKSAEENLRQAQLQWQKQQDTATQDLSSTHQAKSQNAIDMALAKAETLWRVDEAARIAAIEAQWRSRYDVSLSEAQTEIRALRGQADLAQDRVRGEQGLLQTKLTARENELQNLRQTLEEQRRSFEQSYEDRLASIEQQWQTKLDQSQHSLRNQLETAQKALIDASGEGDNELRRVRGELITLRNSLAKRDGELQQAQSFAKEAQERWHRQTEQALQKAEQTWHREEIARLSAAKAEWQEEARLKLEEAIEKCELPETIRALIHAEKSGVEVEDSAKQNLHTSRSSSQESITRLQEELRQLAVGSLQGSSSDPLPEHDGLYFKKPQPKRGRNDLQTAALAAAGAAAIAVLFFVADALFNHPVPPPLVAVAPVKLETSAKPAAPQIVASQVANVRAGPSASTAIIGTLSLGVPVTKLAETGKWVQVTFISKAKGGPVRGWVHHALLKETASGITPK